MEVSIIHLHKLDAINDIEWIISSMKFRNFCFVFCNVFYVINKYFTMAVPEQNFKL